jgi:putative hemolysin
MWIKNKLSDAVDFMENVHHLLCRIKQTGLSNNQFLSETSRVMSKRDGREVVRDGSKIEIRVCVSIRVLARKKVLSVKRKLGKFF